MGKAEQFKIERRLQQAQQAEVDRQKKDKQLSFIYGLASGIAITALVGGIFLAARQPKPATDLKLATGSATTPQQITVPNNIQLPNTSATPSLIQP